MSPLQDKKTRILKIIGLNHYASSMKRQSQSRKFCGWARYFSFSLLPFLDRIECSAKFDGDFFLGETKLRADGAELVWCHGGELAHRVEQWRVFP
jgi:hypothetical protein